MRTKGLIRVVSLVLVLSLLLSGCGSSSVNDASLPIETAESSSAEPAGNDIYTEELSADSDSVSESDIAQEMESEKGETAEDAEAKAAAKEEERRRLEEEQRKEEERQKAEEEAKQKAEEERQKAEEEARQKAEEERIRAEQMNSFSMMYYLAITAEEIRTSKDNRLILDDIYTSLLNDINPGTVDEITQDHLKNLRDIIKSYLSISTKRERLQYIYNQDKAAAIRNAVPNPLAILSMTNSYDWKKLANWSTRYFAAQVYLDLYARTDEAQYLKKAYDIAYDNVTILLQGQRDLNTTYLNEVKEVTVEEPDYKYLSEEDQKKRKQEYKDEQKRAKEYNKALKKERKTELPALYEPLVVNCELLFALADEIGISEADKADIEAILKTGSNGIFLSKPVNDAYSFSGRTNRYSAEMTTDEIIIPANLMTAGSKVQVTVTDNNQTQTFDDCTVTNVKREESSIDSFKAYITSKTLKKYDWTADSKVSVEITYHDAYERSAVYKFSVSEFQDHWYGDKVEFKAE